MDYEKYALRRRHLLHLDGAMGQAEQALRAL